ncbi:MAG: formate dehydrogenase accessory protein FdhE [Thermodesulfobacteriota bacterium]
MKEEVIQRIDQLIHQRPMYREALSVYRELLGFADEGKPGITYKPADASVREIKAREGFPLFSRGSLPIDHEHAAALFQHLLEHLSSTERNDRAALSKAAKRAQVDRDWVKKVIGAVLSGDEAKAAELTQDADLSPTVATFISRMALQPSLRSLRQSAAEEIQGGTWNYGYCPLCGSFPDIAYFSDEGRRFLHCELCGQVWNYQRIKCPFCGEQRADELGYFTSEEEEGYRVDFCRKCKHYIKTVDMRLIKNPAPLEAENLITLYLDLLAHNQGFMAPGDKHT